MRIYISGPIEGNPDYLKKFTAKQLELESYGHEVINPAAIAQMLPKLEQEEHYAHDITLLSLCDAIYMLPGWENSRGANREFGFALGADLAIMGAVDG